MYSSRAVPVQYTRHLATAAKRRPTPVRQISKAETKKYSFYDLVLRTPSHPRHPIEASLMRDSELRELKKHTKVRFEGNYSLDPNISAEERIAKVFGGRIKGEDRQASSRIERGEPKVIAGVTVPCRPPEPDNCCMSGCINCVWELFQDDLNEWNEKRDKAARKLVANGGRWPENFNPPLKLLKRENYPPSLADLPDSKLTPERVEGTVQDETWGDVPVSIRVFTQAEKRIKARHKQRLEELARKNHQDTNGESSKKEQSASTEEHSREQSLQSNTHQKQLQRAQ
ncbi:hypothetical protein KGF57_004826 [Candida theae]|uniref:Oxidoreductase-like domain-containing protein n=1 Tax=Candida theae TaxID=1198502 RepID=A0AAD5FWS7_9ASCO|nr:uncharacterized protein KGF57_004826 [Candida theae]KAI5949228.1 hypothetical protein KGF57_004826 [Candida theae]